MHASRFSPHELCSPPRTGTLTAAWPPSKTLSQSICPGSTILALLEVFRRFLQFNSTECRAPLPASTVSDFYNFASQRRYDDSSFIYILFYLKHTAYILTKSGKKWHLSLTFRVTSSLFDESAGLGQALIILRSGHQRMLSLSTIRTASITITMLGTRSLPKRTRG